jgi:hypothetical protein
MDWWSNHKNRILTAIQSDEAMKSLIPPPPRLPKAISGQTGCSACSRIKPVEPTQLIELPSWITATNKKPNASVLDGCWVVVGQVYCNACISQCLIEKGVLSTDAYVRRLFEE